MTKTRMASLMLLLALGAPAASAQLILTVKVATDSGRMIRGAQVYINGLSQVATTSSSGIATLIIPQDQLNGEMMNVRVRALGYLPGVKPVQLVQGSSGVNFELKGGGERAVTEALVVTKAKRADESRVAVKAQGTRPTMPTRKDVPMVLSPVRVSAAQGGRGAYSDTRPMAGLDRAAAAATPGQIDPFAAYMFPPELVMQYQDEIALKESQRSSIQGAIQEAQTRMLELQYAVSQESQKLSRALDTTTVDEKAVQAQIDRIIGVEREIKRAQMTLLIRVKNALTPEQQTKLRQLR